MSYHSEKTVWGKGIRCFLQWSLCFFGIITLYGCGTPSPVGGPVRTLPIGDTPQRAPEKTPKPQKIHKIGLLLPKTGPYGDLGRDLWAAAEMALFDGSADNVVIHVKDTGGTPGGAVRAFQSLMASRPDIIVGPLFAAEVRAILPLWAKAGRPPLVPLSSDESLIGPHVFVFGLSPRDQLNHALDFAVQQGRAKVAAIVPQGPFGDSMIHVLRARQDLSLAGIVTYDSGGIRADHVDLLRSMDFDTLVIPEGGAALTGILAALRDNHLSLNDLLVLGTGAWDDGLVRTDLLPANAFYGAPDPAARSAFTFSFKKHHGRSPKRLATLGYDSVALAIHALTQSPEIPLQDKLTTPQGFDGLDGLFHLTPTGKVSRALKVLPAAG